MLALTHHLTKVCRRGCISQQETNHSLHGGYSYFTLSAKLVHDMTKEPRVVLARKTFQKKR